MFKPVCHCRTDLSTMWGLFNRRYRPMKGNPRQSWILYYSTPWILDSRYWIPWSLSVELGFRIPKVSGILDSFSCIPDSTTQDSGFQKQKFPGFRNTQFLYMGQTLVIVQSDRAYSQHIAWNSIDGTSNDRKELTTQEYRTCTESCWCQQSSLRLRWNQCIWNTKGLLCRNMDCKHILALRKDQ